MPKSTEVNRFATIYAVPPRSRRKYAASVAWLVGRVPTEATVECSIPDWGSQEYLEGKQHCLSVLPSTKKTLSVDIPERVKESPGGETYS